MHDKIYTALVLLIVVLAYKMYQYYCHRSEHENVRWCATDASNRPVDFLCMLNEITDPEFTIRADEEKSFYLVLAEYQKVTIARYVKQERFSRRSATLDPKTYFFYTFSDYLEKHCCALSVADNKMLQQIETINDYTKRYALTDFGVTYYKAYLATAMYAHSKGRPLSDPAPIRKTLETRTVDILSYRP